jgi:hypothetical protein
MGQARQAQIRETHQSRGTTDSPRERASSWRKQQWASPRLAGLERSYCEWSFLARRGWLQVGIPVALLAVSALQAQLKTTVNKPSLSEFNLTHLQCLLKQPWPLVKFSISFHKAFKHFYNPCNKEKVNIFYLTCRIHAATNWVFNNSEEKHCPEKEKQNS